MIKIEEIQFTDHHVLGNQTIKFVDNGEGQTMNYVSLIIGQNGTGKSQILVAIVDVIIFLKAHSKGQRVAWSNSYKFVVTINKNGEKVIFDLNKPEPFLLLGDNFDDLLPELVLANSYTFNDKFPKIEADGYVYAGLKTASNNIFVARPTLDTFNNLSKIIIEKDYITLMDDLFDELNFKKSIKVIYSKRRNVGILRDSKFKKLLFDIATEKKVTDTHLDLAKKIIRGFTGIDKKDRIKRFQDDKINKLLSEESVERLSSALLYLSANINKNEVEREKELATKNNPFIKYEFSYSWGKLSDKKLNDDFIKHLSVYEFLSDLDVLSTSEFQVLRDNYFSFANVSSGEFHLLHLLSYIMSNIKEDSIVLLDEPEISLHINWQQKFFKFIDKIRFKFPSVHFIIATHSHFLVSDLKRESSCIISLIKNASNQIVCKNLESIDTYGWSAEQILFEVFMIPSDRNYYLSEMVTEIVKEIGKVRPNQKNLKNLLFKLAEYDISNLHNNDPLKSVIKKLLNYGMEKK